MAPTPLPVSSWRKSLLVRPSIATLDEHWGEDLSSQRLARDTHIVVISCQVLQDLLLRLLPKGLTSSVTFLDYGLHRVPAKMTLTLQEALDNIEEPSLVVLGYGLCGNGLKGLRIVGTVSQKVVLKPSTPSNSLPIEYILVPWRVSGSP